MLCLLVFGLAVGSGAAAEGPGAQVSAESTGEPAWELLERDETPGSDYALWARLPPGSSWRAFRLEGEVDATPEVALEAALRVASDPGRAGRYETRRLLSQTPDALLTYTHVDLPVVADRDVIMRLRREVEPERGVYRLVWREVEGEGPLPEEGVVRMPLSRGVWTFEPLPGSRSRVVFENHAELGGSIPAWIINPLMTGTIKSNLDGLRQELTAAR